MSRTYRRKELDYRSKYIVRDIARNPKSYIKWLRCKDGNVDFIIKVFLNYYHSDAYRTFNNPRYHIFHTETKPLRLRNNRKLRMFQLDAIFETKVHVPYYY